MQANQTHHALVRQQQRGVPPLIRDWLLDFGEEQYDGHGGVLRYFSRNAIRKVERSVGKTPVARMSEYLRCYLVQSSHDGAVITLGKRYSGSHVYKH